MFAGKFKREVYPNEGLHHANCRNPGERRVLEFLMPILNPEKPKRITLTMANTLFGALFEVRLVNWGVLIHIISRAIPYIGKKPSYLSPYILHLYQHYECATIDKEDLLTIATKEVAYKLLLVIADTSTSSDPIIRKHLHPHREALLQVFRDPTLHRLPHHIIIRKQPDLVGPSRIRLGGTWIYPPMIFRKLPSSGFTTTWWISRPSITG